IPRPRMFPGLLWGLLLAAFAASQVVHIVAYSRNDARITSLTPLFPFYMPFTSHRNADKYGDLLPLEMQEAALGDMSHSTLHYPREALAFRDAPYDSLPDVLVLMLESWRTDTLVPEVMPNACALAERSVVLTDHLSTGNQTTCGVFGFFYGLHATYWPAVKANSAAIDNPVLIDAMTDRGYDCKVLARSGFDRHKIEDAVFRGIDVVDRFPSPDVPGWDRDLTDQLKDFMRDRTAAGRRWFAYGFFKATHFSYAYPDSMRRFTPTADLNVALADMETPVEPILNDYRNAARFDDALIGEIVAELEALGRLDRTVIVLTSDHGDEINDNRANYWGHGTNFTRWQVQVPMILRLPGRDPMRVTGRTSHVDVAPTLLEEVFGCITEPAAYSNGVNVFSADLAAPRPFVIGSYVNHAYVFGNDVFAIYPMHTRKYAFDDIQQPADRPPADLMQRAAAEMSRFSEPPAATKDVN
ncbi:sulfatase-like hydrolase/transferase, partial [bacterium]|nr:sulfatase-like hydrolase/transferase [bacterium]